MKGTYRFRKSATSNDATLDAFNDMGAQGYALACSLTSSTATGDYYVSDTAHAGHKFKYMQQPEAGKLSDFLAQLDEQGANGFMFKSPMVLDGFRNLFVRDTSRSDKFTYKALEADLQTPQDMADELNAQGAIGYRYLGPMFTSDGSSFRLYVNRNDGVTYEYVVEKSATVDREGLQDLLTAKGAEGLYMRASEVIGTAFVEVDIYEKNSAQQGAVEYLVEPNPSNYSQQAILDDMNRNAANGFFWQSQLVLNDRTECTISVKNGGLLLMPLVGAAFP